MCKKCESCFYCRTDCETGSDIFETGDAQQLIFMSKNAQKRKSNTVTAQRKRADFWMGFKFICLNI